MPNKPLTIEPPVPDECILVMGATGSGKTSFINKASGNNFAVGTSLMSCTAEFQSAMFRFDDKLVELIDTPGFDDTAKEAYEMFETIGQGLIDRYKNKQKITGIVFLHDITVNRMTARKIFDYKIFKKLCGDDVLSRVAVVTTMWGLLTEVAMTRATTLEQGLGQYYQPARGPLRLDSNTPEAAHTVLRVITSFQVPSVLQIQTEYANAPPDIGLNLHDTAAGQLIMQNMREGVVKLGAKYKQSGDSETERRLKDAEADIQDFMRRKFDVEKPSGSSGLVAGIVVGAIGVTLVVAACSGKVDISRVDPEYLKVVPELVSKLVNGA